MPAVHRVRSGKAAALLASSGHHPPMWRPYHLCSFSVARFTPIWMLRHSPAVLRSPSMREPYPPAFPVNRIPYHDAAPELPLRVWYASPDPPVTSPFLSRNGDRFRSGSPIDGSVRRTDPWTKLRFPLYGTPGSCIFSGGMRGKGHGTCPCSEITVAVQRKCDQVSAVPGCSRIRHVCEAMMERTGCCSSA